MEKPVSYTHLTYDLQPEMSAPQVCEKLVDAIKSDKYDVIVINFANPDMVGHTGVQDVYKRQAQTQNLRMDTYSDNIPMQKLLEKCGFQYCGSFERLGMDKWMAYQKI